MTPPPELEPVLRDVAATTDLRLRMSPYDWDEDGTECLMVEGTGVTWSTDASGAPLVARLAEQVQGVVVEELWGHGSNWPQCPEHPSNHPMDARLQGDAAWWCCPASGRAVVRVGELQP